MTCIVAVKQGKIVWMGADRCMSSGWSPRTISTSKIARVGDITLGFSGSVRAMNLLATGFEPPKHPHGMSTDAYIMGPLVEAIRGRFKTHGHTKIDSGVESAKCYALLAYRGKLYELSSDFCIVQLAYQYLATGSGEPYALGALHATKGLDPEKRVRAALEAAAEFGFGVRGPFDVVEVTH